MTTKFSKSELIEVLKTRKGELVVTENQVGFNPKNSPLYYYFKEKNGLMETDYMYSQMDGSRKTSFTRFWNFVEKLN